MQESIVFLVRVQCRRKESSPSLSHLLMSFLCDFIVSVTLIQLVVLRYVTSHLLAVVTTDVNTFFSGIM